MVAGNENRQLRYRQLYLAVVSGSPPSIITVSNTAGYTRFPALAAQKVLKAALIRRPARLLLVGLLE